MPKPHPFDRRNSRQPPSGWTRQTQQHSSCKGDSGQVRHYCCLHTTFEAHSCCVASRKLNPYQFRQNHPFSSSNPMLGDLLVSVLRAFQSCHNRTNACHQRINITKTPEHDSFCLSTRRKQERERERLKNNTSRQNCSFTFSQKLNLVSLSYLIPLYAIILKELFISSYFSISDTTCLLAHREEEKK